MVDCRLNTDQIFAQQRNVVERSEQPPEQLLKLVEVTAKGAKERNSGRRE